MSRRCVRWEWGDRERSSRRRHLLACDTCIHNRDPRSESSAAHHVINQSCLSSCDKSMISPCFLSCHAPRENNSIKTAIECKQGTPAYTGDIGDRKKETIKTIQMDRVMLMIHHWTLCSRFGMILFYLLPAIIAAFGGSQVGSLREHNSLTNRHSSQDQGRGKVGSRRVRARNPWCLSEKLKQITEWRRRVKTSRGTAWAYWHSQRLSQRHGNRRPHGGSRGVARCRYGSTTLEAKKEDLLPDIPHRLACKLRISAISSIA